MSLEIVTLPPGLAVSQASFGRSHSERVEVRARSGIEDRFRDGADRWTASFIAAPSASNRDEWRAFVMELSETGALVYVHDINAARPYGGERRLSDYFNLPFVMIDESGDEVALVDADDETVEMIGDPESATAKIEVSKTADEGAALVEIAGLHPGVVAIRRGAYVQIGHWLYLARVDVVPDYRGVAEVPVHPALWRAAPLGEGVKLTCAGTLMRLDQKSTRWTGSPRDRRHAIAFTFREVLPPEEGIPL